DDGRQSPVRALNPLGRAPLATRSRAKQPMARRRARAVLRPGRVSLALIGRKLVWERKFGKFHTSRSRAAGDINKAVRQAREQTVSQSFGATVTTACARVRVSE
ncbi:tRNA-specific 2-thiouridylase MnmA, partial [Clarias magur]